LVFEPTVVGLIGECHMGRCPPGVVAVVMGEPVKTALRSNGATTPTMIRKRNVAPVDLGRRLPGTHVFGRWVGRPGSARRMRDCGAEQNTQFRDDKHFSASHRLVEASQRLFEPSVNIVDRRR
jgi:hypothetical protein